MTSGEREYVGYCGIDPSSADGGADSFVVAVHRVSPGGRRELVSLQRVSRSGHLFAPKAQLGLGRGQTLPFPAPGTGERTKGEPEIRSEA